MAYSHCSALNSDDLFSNKPLEVQEVYRIGIKNIWIIEKITLIER